MQRSAMTRQQLPWDDVRLFLALCRAPTVGAAARELGVDPSTVSRRLGALEQAVAATLFDRGREGIAPTAAAEELMPVAEAIEEAMARFGRAAEGLEREVSGLVRITCPPDAAEVAVVPLVQELLRLHPALRVDLEAGEALLELTRREADLAIRTVRPVRGDLIVTRLFTVTWVVAASPAMARELGTLRSWTDAPWVSWGERRSHTETARWYARHVRCEPVARSDSMRVQLALVQAGAGVTLMPARSVAHYGLVPVKLGAALRAVAGTLPSSEMFLVTHRALRDVPRVRVVWDLLLERLAERA